MTQSQIENTTIEVDELRALLESGQSVTVLDIRTADVRAEGTIPGSVHFDAYKALNAGDPEALAGLELPPDRPVVTVCSAGKMSLVAMEQLRKRGFSARSLTGGVNAWSLAGNRTTSHPIE